LTLHVSSINTFSSYPPRYQQLLDSNPNLIVIGLEHHILEKYALHRIKERRILTKTLMSVQEKQNQQQAEGQAKNLDDVAQRLAMTSIRSVKRARIRAALAA
jgi:hypothetical protein